MRGRREGSPGGTGALTVRLGRGREFDLIRRLLERPGAPPPAAVRVAAGDDCTIVAGEGIAVTCDLSVEGVHFRREWLSAEEIGYRAAAAAFSDLAAMAAAPLGVLAAIALPEPDGEGLGVAVGRGIAEAAQEAGAALLGGDLSRSPGPLVIDVIALGNAPEPVLRNGGRAGDEVWVTGALGASAAAVQAWRAGREPAPAARARFARPRPRLAEARWLAEHAEIHAMIDLSDGLAGDAGHLAAASGVALVLDLEAVPVDPVALEDSGSRDAALRLALTGGEDYELCLVAAPGTVGPRRAAFEARFAVRLTRVGRVAEGEGVAVETAGGPPRPLELEGFDHFGRFGGGDAQ